MTLKLKHLISTTLTLFLGLYLVSLFYTVLVRWIVYLSRGNLPPLLICQPPVSCMKSSSGVQSILAPIVVFLYIVLDALATFALKCYICVLALKQFIFNEDTAQFASYIASSSYTHRPLERPEEYKILAEKAIIFIRHGESVWNYMFNDPRYWAIPWRVAKVVAIELFWKSFTKDSLILDSPLSPTGIQQALHLNAWLATYWSTAQDPGAKPSDSHASKGPSFAQALESAGRFSSQVVVSSDLRRSISTSFIGLQNVLGSNMLQISNSLHESTRNFDGISLSSRRFLLTTPGVDDAPIVPDYVDLENSKFFPQVLSSLSDAYANQIQGYKTSENAGDLLTRLFNFAHWTVSPAHLEHPELIAIGHSIWLWKFFTAFLPPGHPSPYKFRKLGNCGVYRFKMIKYLTPQDKEDFWIDPKSIQVLHGGFVGTEQVAPSWYHKKTI